MVDWEYCGVELRERPYRLLWVQEWYEAVAVSPDGRPRRLARSEPFIRPSLGPEGLSTRQEKVLALQNLVSQVVDLGWQLLPGIDDRLPRFRRPLVEGAASQDLQAPDRGDQSQEGEAPPGDELVYVVTDQGEIVMNDAESRGSGEAAPRLEPRPTAPPELEALLARIDGFQRALTDYERRIHERDAAVRDQESRATQQLAEAQQRATTLIERTQQQSTDLNEALRRALAAEEQLTARHTALAERERALQERETRVTQAAQQLQAEQAWLQQYAQTVAHVVGELERALNVALPSPPDRRLPAGHG